MAREWTIEKAIDGKKYKIHYSEWEYLGGSILVSSKMECIDDRINNQKNYANHNETQGEKFGKSKK